jgi:integrase
MLPRTMVGLAILSGLRRGELFALRWRDIDEQARLLTVREAVYDGVFSTPKTEAGARQIPLSESALTLIVEWKAYVGNVKPDALIFSTSAGTSILPNNVVQRLIFPACKRLGLPRATWLTDHCAKPSTRSAANCSLLFTNRGRRGRGLQRK